MPTSTSVPRPSSSCDRCRHKKAKAMKDRRLSCRRALLADLSSGVVVAKDVKRVTRTKTSVDIRPSEGGRPEAGMWMLKTGCDRSRPRKACCSVGDKSLGDSFSWTETEDGSPRLDGPFTSESDLNDTLMKICFRSGHLQGETGNTFRPC
ncbi:hypothetical protein PV04_01157 [Phialophora macrospora]|uniref:Uncharacterized protein n=1 Tax=Phialophora macrospora TaxID=1851006 RepID=A0A0D2EFF3_9EURO|nr:hypothetical protein PV04_01157 [Phialophora macrospora]